MIASDPRNVAQGWFAEGDGPPEGHEAATRVRPAAFDAWDCRLYEPHYKMQAACPAAAGHVARFRLRDYFEHKLTTGPFATKYSAWTKHVGGEFGVTWPELRMPASAHGGWLHERIQQRRPSGSGLGGGVVTDVPTSPTVNAGSSAESLESQLSGCRLDLPSPAWRRASTNFPPPRMSS